MKDALSKITLDIVIIVVKAEEPMYGEHSEFYHSTIVTANYDRCHSMATYCLPSLYTHIILTRRSLREGTLLYLMIIGHKI